jgi:catechol 2,3-dioxygenase-like lactoylglutathione lyase family enzyme
MPKQDIEREPRSLQAPATGGGDSMTPQVLGISHVSLSVADVAAAARFWTEVMGFETFTEHPRFRFLIHFGARLAMIVTDHESAVTDHFDERRTGLDHLAFAVADVETLRAWEQRLTAFGVPNSGITETDGGHHLNLRAPDNLPLELFVMSASMLSSLGLGQPTDAVAHSYP